MYDCSTMFCIPLLKRLRLLVLFTSICLLLPIHFATANSHPRTGLICEKAGTTKTYQGRKYTCISNGTKLQWSKGSLVKKRPQTLKPSPNTAATTLETSENSEAKLVASYMQEITNKFVKTPVSTRLELEIINENSRDLMLINEVAKYLRKSMDVLAQWGTIDRFSKVLVLNYRSKNWLEEKSRLYCLKTWGQSNFTNANFGICNTDSTHNFIAISAAAISTNQWDFPSENLVIDLDSLSIETLSRLQNLGPHEFFHTWQYSLWGREWQDIPSWYVEGFAEVFANLVRATLRERDNSYSLAFSNWRNANDIAWSKNACKESIRKITFDMRAQCQYSQGMAVAEYFLYRFGGPKALNDLSAQIPKVGFNTAFESVTKTNLDSFYSEADDYLRTLGWSVGK